MRLDQLVAQSLLRQRRGNRSGWRRHHRAHPLDERAAAGRQLHRLQIVLSVQNAIGQRLLLRQHLQHHVLDAVLGHEVDDIDRPHLVFPPGARDALFQLCRVPRQIQVDHGACYLEVEPDAAAVRRKEQPTVRITLEARDLCAAAVLRHRSSKAWRQNNVFVVPPCGSPMASSRERAT